jgi:Domain of unknown function (DUF4345)
MAARVFLALSALLWLSYGIYCFFVPGSLAEAAGIGFATPTGSTELRAMYGGLQAGLGLLAGLAVARRSLVRPALVALAFLAGGLATARLLGVVLDGGLSSYTQMGLAFELVTVAVASALALRTPA